MQKHEIFQGAFWAAKGKSVLSKLAKRNAKDQVNLSFDREAFNEWFAVIPSWPGPKSALAMVDGADSFLDSLTEVKGCTRLTLSLKAADDDTTAFDDWHLQPHGSRHGELHFLREHPFGDGAYYTDAETGHEMWLCGVTEFVFGRMPARIHFAVVG